MSYHFWEHFWCPSRWQGQKFNFQVILYDFLDGQDPFTKSGGHARSLRPEVWNFAWDLVWPIHMPYKNTGSIWEKKLIFGHPSVNVQSLMPKNRMFFFFELDSKAALLITVYDALNMSDPGFTASAFFSDTVKKTKCFIRLILCIRK